VAPQGDLIDIAPCCKVDHIIKEQVAKQLQKIKPYKAPGPDSISNINLTKCTDLLLDRLFHIYTAIYEKKFHYKLLKYFTTIILHKPGKPHYNIPKAYRPIALLNMMWKVLTGILVVQLSHYTGKYYLLPDHHYSGWQRQTTTDAMHMLTYRIKEAWCKGKVASVLFLDIEGAFPNAVLEKLVHNLRKCKVPLKLIDFTEEMLNNRAARLRFNDYKSDIIPISNGIGQGDPLSMGLY